MPIIRTISGLRATYDDGSLNKDLVKDYINALALMFIDNYSENNNKKTDKTIAVGRDGRPTGQWIEETVINELINKGFNVISLGVATTPTIQIITEKFNCRAGISITASHNPMNWNGLKFINRNGIFFDEKENQQLWSYLGKEEIKETEKGKLITEINQKQIHIDLILENTLINSIINEIREKNYNVVVDCVNASASEIVPELLKNLNCNVIKLYCEGNGEFPHIPEPLPENLQDLKEAVIQTKADLGLAIDPDGDRLVLIDENGNAIGEELTVCIAIDSVLSGEKGNVTVNYSTTNLSKIISQNYGVEFYKSPVGEINVVKKMFETNSLIGGEGSGGVIYGKIHYGRDSLVGIGLLLRLLTIRNCSLSQLVNRYPKLEMIKIKQEFKGDFEEIVKRIKEIFKQNEIIEEDGLIINFSNEWVQIRKSNTEPIIRIIAEAESKEKAMIYINKIKECL